MNPWKTKKVPYVSEIAAGNSYHQRQKIRNVLKKAPLGANVQLKNFLARARNGEDKLTLLKEMADVVIEVVGVEKLKARRRSFNSIKNTKFPAFNKVCWVCGFPPWERHHIIQLQNGGPITARNNVVLLCKKCHSDVHPWLGYARPMLLPDYNLAFFKAQATTLLERAACNRVTLEVAETEMLGYLHSVFNTIEKI